MTVARKVYTEAMIRKVLKKHFEVDQWHEHQETVRCDCGWHSTSDRADEAFENHFVDQLHKLWHEMFGRRSSTTTSPTLPIPDRVQA